jgi:hypothetical protein
MAVIKRQLLDDADSGLASALAAASEHVLATTAPAH